MRTKPILIVAASIGLVSCTSWFQPKTPQEKNVLGVEMNAPGESRVMAMRFGGIGLESQPTELNKFSQVTKVAPPQNGFTVYQVYNPNPNVSMMIGWYMSNSLKQLELRYMDSPGATCLSNSSGPQGILSYMTNEFGTPSMVGTNVPIVATQAGLSATNAVFNGVWIFSRVNRQLNYLAYSNMAFINLKEINPSKNKYHKIKNQKGKSSPAPADNPGFTTPSSP